MLVIKKARRQESVEEFQGDGNHIYCPYGRLVNPITQSKARRRAAGMLN